MRSQVHQQVQQQHRREIRRIASEFAAMLGRDDATVRFGVRGYVGGRAASVTDRHAYVTIGMSWMDATDWARLVPAAADLPGTLTTMSLAAHHRMLGTRLPVDLDESDAWARALTAGGEHLLAAGAQSGVARDAEPKRLLTVYYHLYRDASHQPAPLPTALREGYFPDKGSLLRSIDKPGD